ncbi:hypothetical protein RI367_002345 [Sorochytrium milnesiophthora]
MYVPPRGGTRGGQDQFKWDDVKADKHRENYLGHSVMAPVGRWQANRDILWYSKEKKDASLMTEAERRAEELRAVKEAEQDAMLVALGLKAAKRPDEKEVAQEEVKRIMRTRQEEEEAEEVNVDRIGGVGFGKRITGIVNGDLPTVDRLDGNTVNAPVPATQADSQERALHKIAALAQMSHTASDDPAQSSKKSKKDRKDKKHKRKRDRDSPSRDRERSPRPERSSRSDARTSDRRDERHYHGRHRDDRDGRRRRSRSRSRSPRGDREHGRRRHDDSGRGRERDR